MHEISATLTQAAFASPEAINTATHTGGVMAERQA